jgi:succinate dehydrogenase / fumarate reductase cytochrome b subunit
MATATHPAAHTESNAPTHKVGKGVEPIRAGKGYSFLLRKLHSLSGIVPIGAFLVEHILSNFEALKGPAAYAAQVKFLNSLPLVRVLEIGLIFIPLAYHMLYGVYIALRGKSNLVYYSWAGNWMYMTQRWTGYIAFVYICYHVLTQRFLGTSLPENPGAAFAKVQHELANPLILAFYIIAMLAVCWHFSYGIWLFCAKWGITPGNKARQRFAYVCLALGIVLAGMGLASLYAFVGPNYKNTPDNVAPATSSLAISAAQPYA